MVSKAVIKAYADMIPPSKEYVVEAEQEYDFIKETHKSVSKAVEAALDLMKYGYNVSINNKYIGGSARSEYDYPVNQGYFAKRKKTTKKTARRK